MGKTDKGDAADRALPFNIDAERAVLGSILIDPDAYFKIEDRLRRGDFFREVHGWVWDVFVCLAARGQPAGDLVLVADELERRGQLAEGGGVVYLSDLAGHTPTSVYVEHYAEVVKFTAMQRRLIAASGEVAALAWNATPDMGLDALHDKASKILDASVPDLGVAGVITLGDAVTLAVDAANSAAANQSQGAIRTGFTDVDRMLHGGGYPGDLVIVAGRPAMGKTSWCLSWALFAAKHGVRTAFFSLEMPPAQLAVRLLSMETGIDGVRLQTGQLHDEEWPLLMEAANVLSALPLLIVDTPLLTLGAMRSTCKRLNAEQRLGIVFVDYLQLMSSGSGGYTREENRQQEISAITRGLKALARELMVPVVAMAQLSRALESRSDKRPMLSDLRESGEIEQTADKVLALFRDDAYNPDSVRQNIADVIVLKHRTGSTGTVSLYFRKELTQFRDLELQRNELVY